MRFSSSLIWSARFPLWGHSDSQDLIDSAGGLYQSISRTPLEIVDLERQFLQEPRLRRLTFENLLS